MLGPGPSRPRPTNIGYGATSQSLTSAAYGASPESSSRIQIARSLGALSPDHTSNLNNQAVDIPRAKKSEILKAYLVSPDDRSDIDQGKSTEPYSLYAPHQLHGGDTAHDFYKWQKDVEAEPMKRSRSRSLNMPRPEQFETPVSEIRAPGGFRRYHMKMKAVQEGKEPPNFVTRNSVDFLAMIHHFAGEDLSEDEEEEDDALSEYEQIDDEETGLIHNNHGTVSASGACLLLLKSFVGTGVMFLPRA